MEWYLNWKYWLIIFIVLFIAVIVLLRMAQSGPISPVLALVLIVACAIAAVSLLHSVLLGAVYYGDGEDSVPADLVTSVAGKLNSHRIIAQHDYIDSVHTYVVDKDNGDLYHVHQDRSDPFYYIVGDRMKCITIKTHSPVKDVTHHISGFKILHLEDGTNLHLDNSNQPYMKTYSDKVEVQ